MGSWRLEDSLGLTRHLAEVQHLPADACETGQQGSPGFRQRQGPRDERALGSKMLLVVWSGPFGPLVLWYFFGQFVGPFCCCKLWRLCRAVLACFAGQDMASLDGLQGGLKELLGTRHLFRLLPDRNPKSRNEDLIPQTQEYRKPES